MTCLLLLSISLVGPASKPMHIKPRKKNHATSPLTSTLGKGNVEVETQCLSGPWISFASGTCERMASDTTRVNTSKRVDVRIMRQRPAKTHSNHERRTSSSSAKRRILATAALAFNYYYHSGSTQTIEISRFPLMMLSVKLQDYLIAWLLHK